MKKFAFGFLCVLTGCVFGAAMPTITAQSFAPNPAAPRWQHYCVGLSSLRTDAIVSESQAISSARGAEGWELVTTISADQGQKPVLCFKRPAP